MFKKYRSKPNTSVDINMTPMIDIVFQLLTFFMITSTFIQTSSLNVELPEAVSSDSVSQQDNTITLYKDGTLTWNDQPISRNELSSVFQKIKIKDPNAALIIQGDQEIPYGTLVELMDTAKIAGIQKLSLATILKK